MNLFRCFSVPLKKFLMDTYNLKYELIALDVSSNKKFWAFPKNEILNKALAEWNKQQQIKFGER